MKIAVPTKEQNKIDDHFGHCAFYTVFTVNESQITEKKMLPSPQGCGCKSNIAQELAESGVSIMTGYRDWETDRKSTRLNSSHITRTRMPSSA